MRQNIGSWLMGYRRFAVIVWNDNVATIKSFRLYEDADMAFKAGWMHSSDFLAWHRKAGWRVMMSVRCGDAGAGIAPDDPIEWAIEQRL